MALQNPDDALLVMFFHQSKKNEVKSLAEGRDIHDDIEMCEIRIPGSKDVKHFPATELSPIKIYNQFTGSEHKITYAERFKHQYQQFKANAAQTKTGTPLDLLPTLTVARRAELRAQSIYTVEQLAQIDGQELKNLGGGGREMKNLAMEFIAESKATAPSKQLIAELEGLRARNAVLEEDAKIKAERQAMAAVVAPDDYDEMTVDQLREYITTHTGIAPTGALGHKSLKRLAQDIKPSKAA